MRAASDTNNSIPRVGEELSPIEIFSSSNVTTNLRHHDHFGCPVYALDSKMQAGQSSGMKWKERARIGVNLGFSP